MASILVRFVVGLCFYAIGLFWGSIVLLGTLFRFVRGGRKEITKFLKRTDHSQCPEFALKEFNHNHVKTKSGMKFHYVHAGSEDSPLMLCMHGFPECWYSWKYVIRRFSSEYHVVAYDARGYGDSYKPDSIGKYHIDYLVNDVKEIIYALGYKKAVIVAHDWGGVVAWNVPRYFPEVVDKLIIMNAPKLNGIFSFGIKNPSQFLKSWYVFFFQLPYFPELLTSANDYNNLVSSLRGRGSMRIRNSSNILSLEETEVYKHCVAGHLHCCINYYRALNPLYQGMGLQPVTKQVMSPTFLIWGSEDNALDVRMAQFFTKDLPNAKSFIVDGASHWVALDEPKTVMDAMENFLEAEN